MSDVGPPPSSDVLSRLLGPADPELTCAECFEQLDRYVELEISHADPPDADQLE